MLCQLSSLAGTWQNGHECAQSMAKIGSCGPLAAVPGATRSDTHRVRAAAGATKTMHQGRCGMHPPQRTYITQICGRMYNAAGQWPLARDSYLCHELSSNGKEEKDNDVHDARLSSAVWSS